jgi:NDP-sugar pyrophosphorylase family protein
LIDIAVILAFGSAFHQSQLIYSRPRPMLPVLGKPLVVRAMELLYRAGIQHFIVVVGEEEGAVAAYLSNHWLPNVRLEFVIQYSSASLIRTLSDIARQQRRPFIISSYNTFMQPNFPERLLKHSQEAGDALVIGCAHTTLSKSSITCYAALEENHITAITRQKISSNSPIVTNMAACGQEFVDYLATVTPTTGTFSKQIADIFQSYIGLGRLTLMAEATWALQVEADYDLLTLNKYLLDDGLDTYILSELPASIQVVPPVRIDPNVSVGQGARIGPRVYLEAGCTVGAQAKLSNTIVLQNAVVPSGEQVSDMIVSSRARISDRP